MEGNESPYITALDANGINLGWASYMEELSFEPVPVYPSKDSYMDILAEASLVLQGYGLLDDTNKLPVIEKITGMEVGDDRKDESNSPTGLAVSLVVQQSVYKMITSKEDTFISKNRSNFCEVTTIAPRTQMGSFDYARRTNTMDKLEFVDVMPLRLVLDVSKSNKGDHSSSVPGKASMAGPKMSQCRHELREELYLGNLLQDGCLLTTRSKEPKYLPTIMGGSGSPALYGTARNLFLYMHAYRGGGHSRVYGTSTNEVWTCLQQLEETGTYRAPLFTLTLRSKEEYLRVTYKEKVFVASKQYEALYKATSLPAPLYEAGRTSNELTVGESRLMAAKLLTPRSTAEIEVARTRRNQQVLFGKITVQGERAALKAEAKEARKGFDGALAANTAVCRMLERRANDTDEEKLMKDSFFNFSNAGERDFHITHAQWIVDGCKSNSYDLRDLRRPEDMFVRTEVSTEEEMKVSGIDRIWVKNGKQVLTQTRSTVGLWRVSESMYQHAEGVLAELIEAREMANQPTLSRATVTDVYYRYRENDADDAHITRRALNDSKLLVDGAGFFVLISTDIALAKVIAAQTNISVVSLSPASFIPKFGKKSEEKINALDGNQALFSTVAQFHKDTELQVTRVIGIYVDTGSLQAALARYTSEVLPERKSKEKTYRRRLVMTGVNESGHRYETVGLKILNEPEGKITFSRGYRKDDLGYPRYVYTRGGQPVKIRVAKYRSYIDSESDLRSEASSGLSILSKPESTVTSIDAEFNFAPYLNPDNLD
jgi:hypothetical protein